MPIRVAVIPSGFAGFTAASIFIVAAIIVVDFRRYIQPFNQVTESPIRAVGQQKKRRRAQLSVAETKN